jgi:hypothetical protein
MIQNYIWCDFRILAVVLKANHNLLCLTQRIKGGVCQ